MPTYVYRREDGSTFETQQRITEPALDVCPTTGQKVKRVISSAGVIFKGSGFYETDYVRNQKNGSKETSEEDGTKKETKSDAKAETKSTSEKDSSNTETKSD